MTPYKSTWFSSQLIISMVEEKKERKIFSANVFNIFIVDNGSLQ